MIRYRAEVRIFVVSAVFTSVCFLSTRAEALSITFDLRGTEGSVVKGLTTGSVAKHGLTATLTANDGVLNQTASGFGINASLSGDDTDTIDNGSGISEFLTIAYDKLVTFDQLILSSFATTEDASLTFAGGTPNILVGTSPSADVYNFSTDNTISVGQSVLLSYRTGNGFSVDQFTVTTVETTATPEPATIALLGVGLAVLGIGYLQRQTRRVKGCTFVE